MIYYELFYKDKIVGERPEKEYILGTIEVSHEEGVIRFPAKVMKNSGDAMFVLYVQGYRWMEKESAIVSGARLQDLQFSLASLNWQDWDDLWNRKKTEETAKYKLFVAWTKDGKNFRKQATELVQAKGEKDLYLWDLVFLGSPAFDDYITDDSAYGECSRCPVFDIEKKTILGLLGDKKEEVGYNINSDNMPPQGSEVVIEIIKE